MKTVTKRVLIRGRQMMEKVKERERLWKPPGRKPFISRNPEMMSREEFYNALRADMPARIKRNFRRYYVQNFSSVGRFPKKDPRIFMDTLINTVNTIWASVMQGTFSSIEKVSRELNYGENWQHTYDRNKRVSTSRLLNLIKEIGITTSKEWNQKKRQISKKTKPPKKPKADKKAKSSEPKLPKQPKISGMERARELAAEIARLRAAKAAQSQKNENQKASRVASVRRNTQSQKLPAAVKSRNRQNIQKESIRRYLINGYSPSNVMKKTGADYHAVHSVWQELLESGKIDVT